MNLRLLGFTAGPVSDHTVAPVMPHEIALTLPVPANASRRTMIGKISDAVFATIPTAQRTDVLTMVRETVANTRRPFDAAAPAGWPPGHVHLALVP